MHGIPSLLYQFNNSDVAWFDVVVYSAYHNNDEKILLLGDFLALRRKVPCHHEQIEYRHNGLSLFYTWKDFVSLD